MPLPRVSVSDLTPHFHSLFPHLDTEVSSYLVSLLADEWTDDLQDGVRTIGARLVAFDVCDDNERALQCAHQLCSLVSSSSSTSTTTPLPLPLSPSSVEPSSSSDLVGEGDEEEEVLYEERWKPVHENMRSLLLPGLPVQIKPHSHLVYVEGVIDSVHVSAAQRNETQQRDLTAEADVDTEAVGTSGNDIAVRVSTKVLHVGIERLKIRQRVAVNKATIELAAARLHEKISNDTDPFEAAFAVKRFDAPRGISRFGEKTKKPKSVQIQERKELTKSQLKKEAKLRRLAELTARRERLRIERAAMLQKQALEKYLASDKSIKVVDIEIPHLSLSTPDGSQELITNSRLKLVQGRRYALVGRNGTDDFNVTVSAFALTGKTSLLRVIANYEIEDFPENVRVVHVEQEASASNITVIDAVIQSDAEREMLLKEEAQLLTILDENAVQTAKEIANKTLHMRRQQAEEDRKQRAEEDKRMEASSSNETATEELNLQTLMNEIKDMEEAKEQEEDEDEEDPVYVEEDAASEKEEIPYSSTQRVVDKVRNKSNNHVSSSNSDKVKVAPHVRYQEVLARLLEIDAYGAEARARTILNGLAFSRSRQDQLTKDLSGGWRMRVAIACALFVAPDLLLLDEPTNHLDFPSVIWLEQYLLSYGKTMIIVSHDRSFLNTVCTDVVHLYQRNLNYYRGDYTSFNKVRKAKLLQMKREFDAQKLKRAHIEQFIAKFRYNASRAALVQSRIKSLQRMDALVEVVEDQEVKFSFPQPDQIPGLLIGMKDVSFTYTPGKMLLNRVNVTVDMNSRIAILGANGVGKSTLLHLMLGRFPPVSGSISRSSAVRISTFTQHHIDTLDMHLSPLDAMAKLFPGQPEEFFRRQLGGFGITGGLATQEISSLSGGQKSRVALAVVTWRKPSLIVMDEPTNHLDMETSEALIAAIKAFDGGVVVVSHDEHFLTSIANEFYGVGNGQVTHFDSFAAAKKYTYACSNPTS